MIVIDTHISLRLREAILTSLGSAPSLIKFRLRVRGLSSAWAPPIGGLLAKRRFLQSLAASLCFVLLKVKF